MTCKRLSAFPIISRHELSLVPSRPASNLSSKCIRPFPFTPTSTRQLGGIQMSHTNLQTQLRRAQKQDCKILQDCTVLHRHDSKERPWPLHLQATESHLKSLQSLGPLAHCCFLKMCCFSIFFGICLMLMKNTGFVLSCCRCR